MQIIEILDTIPLFKGLSKEDLQSLAAIVIDQMYDKGQGVFAEGDPGTGFYVVVEGKVKVFKLSSEGKEQILHFWGPGEPFGEVALFSGKNFPAFAEAAESSRVFYFPRSSFAQLITDHPSLALNMLGTMAMRLHKFANLIEDLSLKEVSSRLAAHILGLSRQQGESNIVSLEMSKGQIASLLGTIPETLSRTLSKMAAQGLIKLDGPKITIMDQDRLEDLAEG